MSFNRGEEFHAEATSTDASSGVALNYFTPGGDSLTLTGTENLFITDLSIFAAAAGQVKLEAQSDGTGTLTIWSAKVGSGGGGVSRPFNTPFMVAPGYSLVLTAASGQVDLQIEGALTYA